MKLFEDVIKELSSKGKTVSTMESCTGGAIANEITNVPGASEAFKFSAVTYSNEFKIKMGVDKDVIDKYTVYSEEVAKEMSKKICEFADSNYGVGITGKMNRADRHNQNGEDDIIFVSVYNRDKDTYLVNKVRAIYETRKDNKDLVIKTVGYVLKSML